MTKLINYQYDEKLQYTNINDIEAIENIIYFILQKDNRQLSEIIKQETEYNNYSAILENINTICQNTLLEYISSKTITISGRENDVNKVFDLLKSNIEDYISNLDTDISINANTIIDNFDNFMLNTINEIEENINNKNITTDDEDNQFMGAKLINDEFNFEAEPERIKIDVSAPVGVWCNDYCL